MNLIENAKKQIDSLISDAYNRAAQAGELTQGAVLTGTVEIPRDTKNGDYAANHAMTGAKALHAAPRKIAEALTKYMELDGSYFRSVEIAGPGFINFRLGDKWYADVLAAIEAEGADYGRTDSLRGRKIMVEFVSANPTGPMHMGNARGGVLGDALAEVLSRAGAEVAREFYVNDAGNQIEKFALSIEARYIQLIRGEDALVFPEDAYHGDDIRELARMFREENGDGWLDRPESERRPAMAKFGLEHNLPKMRSDLERYKIHYDRWFLESELHAVGAVEAAAEELTKRGYTYEKDGALWLATSKIMGEKLRAAGKTDEDIEKRQRLLYLLRRRHRLPPQQAGDPRL